MKIVIGLGNPGEKYKDTRHNVGFDFVNQLSEHPRFSAVSQKLTFSSSKKFQAEIAETQIAGEKVILIKPQTYMNLSGNTVKVIMNYFHASNEDLLIVSDDLYLRLGMARIRLEGSSGGHKGLESIIDSLGTENFTRLRIGISEHYVGEQESEEIYQKIEAKKFVLEKFSKRERPIVEQVLRKSANLIIGFIGKKEQIKAQTFGI